MTVSVAAFLDGRTVKYKCIKMLLIAEIMNIKHTCKMGKTVMMMMLHRIFLFLNFESEGSINVYEQSDREL